MGERGVRLSGGQKQRVCLARAVVANAPVLVLEADAHEDRLFSAERLERQLADFVEQHREQFADRLVAY